MSLYLYVIILICHYYTYMSFQIYFLHCLCKLTINKFVQFTYSCAPRVSTCAPRVSTCAPTFSEPSVIFLRRLEQYTYYCYVIQKFIVELMQGNGLSRIIASVRVHVTLHHKRLEKQGERTYHSHYKLFKEPNE